MAQTKTKELQRNTIEVKDSSIFKLVKRNKVVEIAIANRIVSKQKFKSFKDAESWLYNSTNKYELLFNIACIAAEFIINNQNLINNENKTIDENAEKND